MSTVANCEDITKYIDRWSILPLLPVLSYKNDQIWRYLYLMSCKLVPFWLFAGNSRNTSWTFQLTLLILKYRLSAVIQTGCRMWSASCNGSLAGHLC